MDTKNISWPGWETVGIIGRGSFGAVYEIQRDVFGDVEKAALKVISIPQHESDIDEMYSDGYDDESITSTFQNHLKSIVAEYTLMKKMSNSANIVHSDDIRYIQHENGFGWDIFIKMELLTPLTKALPADIPEETVVKLAKDMCAALELCRKHGVVHRDIKPQNIFLSPDGEYKLGDFGIAKTVEKTMGGTKIGTYKYMAPEVYNNQPYGMGADIYSLGLVLYWMLNKRRMPFLPLPPEKLSSGTEERARNRRFSGEPLPPPAHGSADLKKIVLKACAFDPKERYSSAAEMLQDLNEGFGSEAVRRRKEEEQRRKEQEEQERLRKELEEKLRKEKEAQERIRKEREEQELLRKEREEQERLQRELAEQERLRKEKEEKQHKEKEAQEHAHEEKKPAGNKKWIVAAALVLVCIICGVLFFATGGEKTKSANGQQNLAADRNVTIVTVGDPATGILEKAAELMEEENYTLTIVDLSDYDKPNYMVENGEADANLFQHETYMTAFNNQHGTHLTSVAPVFYLSDAGEEYSITLAVKVGNESSEKIQTLIRVLQSEEIAQYINETYFGTVLPMKEFGGETTKSFDTVANNALTVAVSPDLPPMSFIDSTKTGQDMYVGFEISLAKYIADHLGLALVLVPMDFDACDDAIYTGSVDLAIASFSWSEERAENYNISDYYHVSVNEEDQILITLASNGDNFATADNLTGAKIGAQNASLQQSLVEEQLPENELVLVDDLGTAVLKLKNGDLDCLAVDGITGAAIIANNPEIAKSGFAFECNEKYTGSVILLQKGNDTLTNIVNQILDESAQYWDTWYSDAVCAYNNDHN